MNIDLSEATDMNFKPGLYDIHNILNQEIVGEYRSRMSLFTNFVLADKFVLMAGPRSSGKTWISDHIRDYFLGDIEKNSGTAYSITMGSKKAGWYQVDKINRASHIFIFEMNQMPEDFIEILKQWGEGKDASYKVTITQNGARTVQSYTLKKKPTVFCLADEQELTVGEQLSSRLTVIRTDSSIEQNRKVMFNQAILAKSKLNPMQINREQLNKIREYIATLPSYSDIEFKHPASELFVKAIPPFFTDCRRDFPKYLENTYGITRFHWKDRIRIDRGKNKTIMFVTPEDMFFNHIIYGQTLIESALKCSPLEKDMVEIVKSLGNEVNRANVQRNLRSIGQNISSHMCSKYLNQLSDIGYLVRTGNKSEYLYSVGDLFHEFSFNIDWSEVVDSCTKNIKIEFPEVADAYIEKYCKDPVIIHPFSGEKIRIRGVKEQKIDLIENKKNLKFFTDKETFDNSDKEETKQEYDEEIV